MVKPQYLFLLILLTCFGLGNVRSSAVADDLKTTDVGVENETTSVIPTEGNTSIPPEENPNEPQNVVPQQENSIIIEPEVIPEQIETRLILKLNERRVYIYKGDEQVAMYPVAVGKKGWETPTGDFQVMQMIENPTWQNPWNGRIVPAGPKNPLGERWIGFWTDGKNYIGFHGTAGEHLIGQAVSHGCVRMRNSDIKAIYSLIKVGTRVIVVP